VLIGPNGAGKTNFLEIIQQVIKTGLLLDFSYNKDLIKSNPKEVVKRE
jgi:recombinational DNA repair ATPase RecF